jgi:hypothetical protein
VKYADFEQAPCQCVECVRAGVHEKPQRRDPWSGKWLHGYDLKRLYDAEARFWQQWRTFLGSRA